MPLPEEVEQIPGVGDRVKRKLNEAVARMVATDNRLIHRLPFVDIIKSSCAESSSSNSSNSSNSSSGIGSSSTITTTSSSRMRNAVFEDAGSMIDSMLVFSPLRRPTAATLSTHPFVSSGRGGDGGGGMGGGIGSGVCDGGGGMESTSATSARRPTTKRWGTKKGAMGPPVAKVGPGPPKSAAQSVAQSVPQSVSAGQSMPQIVPQIVPQSVSQVHVSVGGDGSGDGRGGGGGGGGGASSGAPVSLRNDLSQFDTHDDSQLDDHGDDY